MRNGFFIKIKQFQPFTIIHRKFSFFFISKRNAKATAENFKCSPTHTHHTQSTPNEMINLYFRLKKYKTSEHSRLERGTSEELLSFVMLRDKERKEGKNFNVPFIVCLRSKNGACFIKLIRLIKNSSNYQHEKYACMDPEDFFNCCFACLVKCFGAVSRPM